MAQVAELGECTFLLWGPPPPAHWREGYGGVDDGGEESCPLPRTGLEKPPSSDLENGVTGLHGFKVALRALWTGQRKHRVRAQLLSSDPRWRLALLLTSP